MSQAILFSKIKCPNLATTKETLSQQFKDLKNFLQDNKEERLTM